MLLFSKTVVRPLKHNITITYIFEVSHLLSSTIICWLNCIFEQHKFTISFKIKTLKHGKIYTFPSNG